MKITLFIDSTDLLNFSETNSGDSQTIHDCLKNLISNLKLEVPNLKAFSSDGVPVLTGSKGGVAAKLRQHQSLKHLLNIQYMHHRLPLAGADSSNQLNFSTELELTLTQLSVFSNNSRKRPKYRT